MKVQFLATGQAPDEYELDIANEVITAKQGDKSEDFDLSGLEEGGDFGDGFIVETMDLPQPQIIRDAERKNGELHVTLCQQSGDVGYWEASDEIDASDYDKSEQYIKRV